jgi:8-hydroxy-5-deazaflavin:NADPH oxidoreductase
MSGNPIRTVGILGAGRVGTALARQALKAGYEVLVATTRPPAEIELLVEVMAPGAKAVTADVAARASDLVILAVPLAKYRKLDPSLWVERKDYVSSQRAAGAYSGAHLSP